eukprot:SAG11_NODE_14145_length_624_cov_1.219466_1_plen_38_part_10
MMAITMATHSLGLASPVKAAPTVPPPPAVLAVGAAKCG